MSASTPFDPSDPNEPSTSCVISTHSISAISPAKLNLCLKVIGQRDDGFHDLQTVFQFIDYADQLHFTKRNDEVIHLNSELGDEFNNKNNLIIKAAMALQAFAKKQNHSLNSYGVDIVLEKNLPIGGGIGGGSSNAATTLLVLNTLWELNYSLDTLAEIGLHLGADVPVFVRGEAAFAEGRGERLQAINIPEYYYILLKPRVDVSTAEIFQHQQLTRDSSPRTIRAFLTGGHDFKGLKQLIQMGNDCEKLVRSLYPEINLAIDALSEFSPAQLTGTGACVFAPFESYQAAETALNALLGKPELKTYIAEAKVVKGLNQSPLHRQFEMSNLKKLT